ncbi:MAG: response regulator [Lachnospiraceae bacterium]|nr:response regulator [Lachnospiraceae bacterium]
MDKIIVIISLSTLVTAMCMTVYGFLQTPSREQKYTLLMAVANFIMCTGNLLCVGSKTFEAAEVGMQLMFLGGPFIPFCFLLICSSICHYNIKTPIVYCLVIFNYTFGSLMFQDSSLRFMFSRVDYRKLGIVNLFSRQVGFLFNFYVILVASYFFAVFYIIHYTKKNRPQLYRNLKSSLLGFYIAGFMSMSAFVITYAFRTSIDLTCYGTTLAFFVFYSAMRRDNIYNIQKSSAEFIINDLEDLLIVHDTRFNYEFSNRAAVQTFKALRNIPFNVDIRRNSQELDTIIALNDGAYYTRDGKEYLLRVIPLKENNKISGYIRWLHDETKERANNRRILELKEEAERANAAKSTFLAHVSHEIRTPINAVIGMNELITRESTEPSITVYANQSIRAGKILLSLINDILDFSKIEAGKMELVIAEYFTSDMIDDIVTMTQFRAEEKKLQFIVNIDDNVPDSLIGDETRVKQIITNIVTNGVKYTETGSVTMSVSYDEHENEAGPGVLKVEVKDTGIGIKKEDLDKLFGSFERIENSVTHKTEGTGLGMSIASSLLNAMNGHMEVDSVYGEGSTFTLYIPQGKGSRHVVRVQRSLAGTGRLAEVGKRSYTAGSSTVSQPVSGTPADSEPSAPTDDNTLPLTPEIGTDHPLPSPENKSFAASSMPAEHGNDPGSLSIVPGIKYTAPDAKIIIVDDAATNLFVAESLLKRTRIQIDTASSGKNFIEMAKKNKYDIILIDYNMPGMNGVEAVNALRAVDNPNTAAPIVMMTAEVDPAADELFKANNLPYTLSKPLNPSYYEAFIAALLPADKVQMI